MNTITSYLVIISTQLIYVKMELETPWEPTYNVPRPSRQLTTVPCHDVFKIERVSELGGDLWMQ